MKKRTHKKTRVKTRIQPEQLRSALTMTAREFMKTPEYQEKAEKRFEELAKQVNSQFNSLGIPQMLERVKKQFAAILEISKLPDKETLSLPRYYPSPPSRAELIEIISEKTADKVLRKLGKMPAKQKGMILFLTKEGDLYRKPKEKYCYSLREEGLRLAIFRSLSLSFKETRIIKEKTGSASAGATRKAIGVINNKARFHLKLPKNQKLIESKPYSGYRINSFYKLKHI